MKQLFGHEVLDGFEEIVRPEHTALLVIDLQNDFLTEGATVIATVTTPPKSKNLSHQISA